MVNYVSQNGFVSSWGWPNLKIGLDSVGFEMSTDGRMERGRVSTDVTLVYEDGTQDGSQDG